MKSRKAFPADRGPASQKANIGQRKADEQDYKTYNPSYSFSKYIQSERKAATDKATGASGVGFQTFTPGQLDHSSTYKNLANEANSSDGGLVQALSGELPAGAKYSPQRASADKFTAYDNLMQLLKATGSENNRKDVANALKGLKDISDDPASTPLEIETAQEYINEFNRLYNNSNGAGAKAQYLGERVITGWTGHYLNQLSGIETIGASVLTGGASAEVYGKLQTYFSTHPNELLAITSGQRVSTQAIQKETGADEDTIRRFARAHMPDTTRDTVDRKYDENTISEEFREIYGNLAENLGGVAGTMLTSWALPSESVSIGGKLGKAYTKGAGGIIKAATAGGKAAKAAGTSLLKGTLEGAKNGLVRAVIGNPGLWDMNASVVGQTANQSAFSGKLGGAEIANAVMQGFVEQFTEGALGFGETADYLGAWDVNGDWLSTLGKTIMKYMVNGGEEGLEEMINVPMSRTAEMVTGQRDFKFAGDGGIFDIKEMLKNGLSGMAMAVIMSGVGVLTDVSYNYHQSLDIGEAVAELNKYCENIPEEFRPTVRDAAKTDSDGVEAYMAEITEALRDYEYANIYAMLTKTGEYADLGSKTESAPPAQAQEQFASPAQTSEQLLQDTGVSGHPEQETQRSPVNAAEPTVQSSTEHTGQAAPRAQTQQAEAALPEAPVQTVGAEGSAARIAQIQKASRSLGKAGQTVLNGLYDDNVEPTAYYGDFARVYHAGETGADIASVEAGVIGEAVKQQAYNAGVSDAAKSLADMADNGYNNANENNGMEANENGEEEEGSQSSSGGGQRAYDMAAAEPGGEVLPGLDRPAGSESQRDRAARISNSEEAKRAVRLSSASQGITHGTSEKTFAIAPRTLLTSEQINYKASEAKKGRIVTYILDQMEVYDEADYALYKKGKKKLSEVKTAPVRAAITADGKHRWIQINHESITWQQFNLHEDFHDIIQKRGGKEYMRRVWDGLIEKHSKSELYSLAAYYAKAYKLNSENLTPEEFQELVDYVAAEILCDAYAGIDIFDFLTDYEGATRYTGEVRAEAKSGALTERQSRGPPEGGEKFMAAEDSGEMSFSREPSRDAEGYRTDTTDWAYDNHIIDKTDRARFYEAIADISKRGYDAPRTKNGAYIIEHENKLMFTDGDFKAPTLSKVIVFQERYGVNNEYAKGLIIDEERNTSRHGNALRVLEGMFGEEYVSEFNASVYGADAWKNGNGKGSYSREADAGAYGEAEKGLKRSQPDAANELRRENAALRDKVEHWQSQTRLTEQPTLRQDDVNKLAKDVVKEYGSTLAATDISAELKALGEFILQGGDGIDELTWSAVKERAAAIARRIVQNASVLINGDETYNYKQIKTYLRNTPISYVNNGDIADYGQFLKKNFGRFTISKNGQPIDSAYQELNEQFGEDYFPSDIINPTDQLLHIAELFDRMRPVYDNPYSYEMATAVEYCANDIVDRLLDESVRQTPPTFADKQAAKLDAQEGKTAAAQQAAKDAAAAGREAEKAAYLSGQMNQGAKMAKEMQTARERSDRRIAAAQQAIADERTRRAEQVAELKERFNTKEAKARESRNAKSLRDKISRHAKELSQKLLRPSDKQHIPEALRGPVARLLESINLESNYEIEFGSDAKYRRVKPGESLYAEPTNRTKAFTALKEAYQSVAGELIVDPDLLGDDTAKGLLDDIIAMGDIRIVDMNSEQLTEVWNTLRAIDGSVRTANKMLSNSRYEHVSELADELRNTARTKKRKGNWGNNPIGWADRLLNVNMMNPLTYLHLFGQGGDALFNELQKARDNRTRLLADTVKRTQEIIGDANINKLRKKSFTFTTEAGETVTLTVPQLMSLYELNKRAAAQDHIYLGGIRPSSSETKALGRLAAPSEGVKVTYEDVANMLSSLSAEDIAIADGLQSLMQGALADAGNAESMRVYGYKKFTEESYFPISSDPHQVINKIGDILEGGQPRPRSIAEWGSAKTLQPKANNGIIIGDVFNVFAQHAVDMATYASHLGVMEDMNRVKNYKFTDGRGKRTGSMGDIIETVAGTRGEAYLNKLLQDVSAGTAKSDIEGLSKLTANYKAASVGMNLRVILQQPTAYFRALAVMGPKYLLDPRVFKAGGWKAALEHAPIAVWKNWGNFEINQGRRIEDIMFNSDKALDKVRSFNLALAGMADNITWGRIWNACELEIKDTQPQLKEGTDEYYNAIAQRFTDIVDQTQVVDNVLGRSHIMRSGDTLAKMATSYMGEPTQSYNLVYRAFRGWQQEQDTAKRSAALKTLCRATTALVLSQFVNAIAQSVIDGLRDDEDRDKKYWERVLGKIGGNFLDNADPTGMIPYIKDIRSILSGYKVYRMDTQAIMSLYNACNNLDKAIKGKGNYTVPGALANVLAEAGRIFGLPVSTLKNDLMSIVRSAGIESGSWEVQYRVERALGTFGSSANKTDYYDILYGAFKAGDADEYQHIAQDLMERGAKASAIESSIKARMKKEQETDPTFAPDQRMLDIIGVHGFGSADDDEDNFTAADLSPSAYTKYSTSRADEYRKLEDKLRSYDSFAKLSEADQSKLLESAYSLAEDVALDNAAGSDYETTTKWMIWATGGAKKGVDEAEAILFKLIYDTTEGDKNRKGETISGTRKTNVMRKVRKMMPWLNKRERDYLMSNYWQEP